MKRSAFFTLALLSFLTGFSQYSKNICSDLGVEGCVDNGAGGYFPASSLDYNGGFYTTPNNSMPFWVGARLEGTDFIDTAFTTSVIFELLSGPGDLNGTLSFGSFKGFKYIDDWSFTSAGSYAIKMIMLGTVLDTLNITVVSEIDLCESAATKGCSNFAGDSVIAFRSSIVSVDAVFPITGGMINKNTGFIDSTWAGTANIAKLSGPGNLWGTKHIEGDKWVLFVDMRFDEIGSYELELEMNGGSGVHKDTFSIEAVAVSNVTELPKHVLEVYPNPVDQQLKVINPKDESSLIVFGVDGRIVYQQNRVENGLVTINFSNFAKGVYTLQLFNTDGSIYETRVVKTK